MYRTTRNIFLMSLTAVTFVGGYAVLAEKVTNEDIVRFQFNTHRLAIASSPPVLEECYNFLEVLNLSACDRDISGEDSKKLSESLANLTVRIRTDLIGEADMTGDYSREQIQRMIQSMEFAGGK